MLPDLKVDELLRLKKTHPCGGEIWKVYRVGADIGIECQECNRRIMLTRRKLARRIKERLSNQED